MPLILTGDQDQALLAMVVNLAVDVARKHNTYVGRTAIQKVMYYLKTQRVQMSYKFDIYHYGPYCQDIVNDIDWLLADSVIKDTSPNPEKYSNYAPGEDIDEILALHCEALHADEAAIRETVEGLIPLDPNLLELLATLDYLLRAEKAKGTTDDLKQVVVNRFMDVKKDKFGRIVVEDMYDMVYRMIEAN